MGVAGQPGQGVLRLVGHAGHQDPAADGHQEIRFAALAKFQRALWRWNAINDFPGKHGRLITCASRLSGTNLGGRRRRTSAAG
jgi:hypothetical protein